MAAPEIADASAGYAAFLRHQVGDMLDTATNPSTGVALPAVFRPDLPRWFDGSMPAACIVVRPAGGYARFGSSTMYLADPRLDVICYGANSEQARRIATTVAVVSKQLMVEVWDGVLLHSANVSGGPVPLPDQQTEFPSAWLAVQVVHGELPQPA